MLSEADLFANVPDIDDLEDSPQHPFKPNTQSAIPISTSSPTTHDPRSLPTTQKGPITEHIEQRTAQLADDLQHANTSESTQHTARIAVDDAHHATAPVAGGAAHIAPAWETFRAGGRGIRVGTGPVSVRGHAASVTGSDSRPSSSHSARPPQSTASTGEHVSDSTIYRATGKVSKAEGLWARFVDWSTSTPQPRRRTRMVNGSWGDAGGPRGPAGGPADFESPAEDPDKCRLRQESGASEPGRTKRQTLEERWRAHCVKAAQSHDLSHIAEMEIAHFIDGVTDQGSRAVLLVVGGHYRRHFVDQEDLLLHVVKEFERVGDRPYVVLYLNSDAPLTPLPDTDFFRELHAALPPAHVDNCKAVYCVHPTAGAKAWTFWLKSLQPRVYGKVLFCEYLHEVTPYFRPDLLDNVLDFVKDYDAAKRARRRR